MPGWLSIARVDPPTALADFKIERPGFDEAGHEARGHFLIGLILMLDRVIEAMHPDFRGLPERDDAGHGPILPIPPSCGQSRAD